MPTITICSCFHHWSDFLWAYVTSVLGLNLGIHFHFCVEESLKWLAFCYMDDKRAVFASYKYLMNCLKARAKLKGWSHETRGWWVRAVPLMLLNCPLTNKESLQTHQPHCLTSITFISASQANAASPTRCSVSSSSSVYSSPVDSPSSSLYGCTEKWTVEAFTCVTHTSHDYCQSKLVTPSYTLGL